MFCPQCSQERISIDTNFCSRCGFLLTATTELLRTGGVNPLAVKKSSQPVSPRRRGVKQGLFILLLTFLVAPIVGMLTMLLNTRPTAVGIAAVLFFMGGLIRMAYALMFESPDATDHGENDDYIFAAQSMLKRPARVASLNPQQTYPVSQYVQPGTGNWRATNDLTPASVTEGTTKLLEKDEFDQ